ncbi:endonuclease/exonuclease/phosphatase family protein [Pseudobacteriovorax antillogorgiicola]|uniref:Uncharacterized conserved protein YafD, endonuclease/exonuclease/phosphatase (EEP) superfamily n=1 Tax=Pseudobacteriovorax antillogorgiicola TaxID=1513793 RepID=A0A1Y6CA07_9BACT|nr:endonuclease/exonuclease/phosphatase family protein [Pseudobacteriovorax antillogorgiicola]TCS48981.1 endonuclease/exonuclease/phosphatase (EEP) superfamily protein YafD [Pseudobacteriovorax antillogorgiicola]SMF53502.1 Uncharacterized conserved protein YafD, endonuclease/exonuclease/phosphatase (EEP) superfamily [Pseudobacteriovorax antillogorgiicola]
MVIVVSPLKTIYKIIAYGISWLLLSLILLRSMAAIPAALAWDPIAVASYLPTHFAIGLAILAFALLASVGHSRMGLVAIAIAGLSYGIDGDHRLFSQAIKSAELYADGKNQDRKVQALALNAQCYTKGVQAVFGFIEDFQPDVVLLSENCLTRERQEHGEDLAAEHIPNYYWGHSASSTTVLTRHELVSYTDVPLPSPEVSLTRHNTDMNFSNMSRRQFGHAVVRIHGQNIHVISLRLIAGRAPSHHPWDKFRWGLKLFQFQKQELAFVEDYLSQLDGPIILGGDLNATPGSWPLKALGKNLKDNRLENSWFGGFTFRNDTLATLRLDFLLYNDRLDSLDSAIIREVVSDHYPVLGTFGLKESH